MPLPFGEDAAVGSAVLRSGVSREVSAYSTECRKCALVAARWQPWKLRGSKPAFDQIPRSLRTALQQPPRPHPDCSRQVVLSRVSQIQTYQPPRTAFGFRRVDLRGSLLFNASEARMPHLRENSTQNPITHIAIGHDPTIAWKAPPTCTPPPICTSAPFLKPRWSQDRGRREQLRNTRWTISRNPFDRTRITSLCECCNAAVVCLESKFLNPRAESGVS